MKKAFFGLNSNEEISKEKIIKGFQYLGINVEQNDRTTQIFSSMISVFEIHSIKNEDESNYNFINLIAHFILMSKGSQKEKASGIFRVFDRRGTGRLFKQEFEHLFRVLFENVGKMTRKLKNLHFDERKMKDSDLQSIEEYKYVKEESDDFQKVLRSLILILVILRLNCSQKQ